MKFHKQETGSGSAFPMAPMIDVVFILLSFFIATQIYARWEKEVDIQLPTAETGEMPERLPGEIMINVRIDGAIVVNQQRQDAQSLRTLLDRLVELFPGQSVVIRADRRTPYEHVMEVLDVCRQADIWNISFATDIGEG